MARSRGSRRQGWLLLLLAACTGLLARVDAKYEGAPAEPETLVDTLDEGRPAEEAEGLGAYGEREVEDSAGEAPAGKAESHRPVLTIITGTHSTAVGETLNPSTQSPLCQEINTALRSMWTLFTETSKYTVARRNLAAALASLQPGDTCTFASTPKGYLYTFPMAMKSQSVCSTLVRGTLTNKKYMMGLASDEARSRVTVNWFLLRPDLVTLDTLAEAIGVKLRYLVTIGHDVATSAMMREGCPRFATILDKREIYQQRMLQTALSDLHHQMSRLRHAEVVVNVCDDALRVQSELTQLYEGSALKYTAQGDGIGYAALKLGYLDRARFGDEALACAASGPVPLDLLRRSHVPSLLATDFFHGRKLVKTVFATPENEKPTLVFIAGVEGSGHHMWSVLGRKHTVRPLYDALTDYLCHSAWQDDSWQAFGPARDRLVGAMRALHGQTLPVDGSRVFFLNTVYSEKAVNMYSYPWGGPRCYLKKYARVMCNIDLLDLAKMAEEADVDFRVVVQRRALGAAIVSSSINRNFGSFVSQTRMLGLSWSLLRTSLRTLDRAFFDNFGYEDMIQRPAEQAHKLARHLGLDPASPLAMHINATLFDSHSMYGSKNVHSWKRKLDRHQFEFMSDFLYFDADMRRAFDTLSLR